MKSKFIKISLNGLEFYSKIGYHKQEQIDGNLFLVNLDLKIKYNKSKNPVMHHISKINSIWT